MSTYSVRRGDTLSELAKKFRTSVDALAKSNNIKDPDHIQVGQKLNVPGGSSTKPSGSSSKSYTVRSGDTLGEIAKRFGTSVSSLAKANNIRNPDRIFVGQKLTIPGAGGSTSKPNPGNPSDGFDSKPPTGGSGGTGGARGPVRDDDGRTFNVSADGTPKFRQGDAQWGGRALGSGSSISAAGCAMTSTAMAISKISGKVINPGELDAYLDKNGGYSGNAINWNQAAKMAGLGAGKPGWSMGTINQQIDAGRPVVIGVDYKAGSNGGSNGTDHWVTVTHRKGDTYYANDPATGEEIALKLQGNRLVGGPKGYKSTGELVTFSGGNPRPGTAPTGGGAPVVSNPPSGGGSLKGVSVPTETLRRGESGEAVKKLQAALVKAGHMTQAEMNTGPGTFGPRTESALKEFQRAHGLSADGVYGAKTRAAFEKLGAKASGSSGPGPVVGPTEPGGTKGGVSLAQLRQIMPNLSQAKAEQYLPHLNRAMAEAGINTPKRQAAFLAQLAHESGEFRYMEEIASGAAYEGRRDLGNTQPGDGVRFKGRGPIQLTGRANYRAAGQALGIDLENNPKRAADPDVGFRTAAWFWNSRNLNSYADAGNFREVTRRINGGYNGLASREAYYQRALNVLS
ncbi:LysM peptidoglycan-binding domain-containing protein [Archangium minus]|uniref:LysM peptidoglycan-binding domain-containing protein n=1 Tax=Archangium TaxID=47 RepID=UPI0037C0715A